MSAFQTPEGHTMKKPLGAALVALALFAASSSAAVLTSGSNLIGSGRVFTTTSYFPMFGTLGGATSVPMVLDSYNEPGTATWQRWSFQSTVEQVASFSWTPGTGYAQRTDNVTLDPRKDSHWGWEEVRWSSNFATPDRRFTTSRHCVFIPQSAAVSGASRQDYCGGPATRGRCGGGSWYVATNYSVFFIDCRDLAAIMAGSPPASIRVKFQTDGSGGYGLLAADANGSTPLSGHLPANTWTTVPLPSGQVWGLAVEGNGQDGGFLIKPTI